MSKNSYVPARERALDFAQAMGTFGRHEYMEAFLRDWPDPDEITDLRSRLEAAVAILNDLRLSPVEARDRAEKALRPDHVGSRLSSEPAKAEGIASEGGDEIPELLAARGEPHCTNPFCTRIGARCVGWHCPHCGGATSSQGHERCDPASGR